MVGLVAAGGSREPAGAVPPLEYQIRWVEAIVLADTEAAGEGFAYRVREVWKDGKSATRAGQSLRLDTRTHELLGYRPQAGRPVVLFLTGPGLQPVEVLPVLAGRVLYAPSDSTVREDLALAALHERVTKEAASMPDPLPPEGLSIPLKVSFIGLRYWRWLALAHNNGWPLLVLFEDHLVQRAVFKTERKYSEIEHVDVMRTDTDNFEITYLGNPLTFSCKMKSDQDLVKVVSFFARKGVKLGPGAQRLLQGIVPGGRVTQ